MILKVPFFESGPFPCPKNGFMLNGRTGFNNKFTYKKLSESSVIIMLKGIPSIISPDLMKALMEMGHGDEIVLADGHFPAASLASQLIRCDGHGIPELLEAILKFFPLDTYVDHPVALMAVVPGDSVQPTIWEEYEGIVEKHSGKSIPFEYIDRFAFYERTKKSFAVVATSEKAQYANIILKKGIVL